LTLFHRIVTPKTISDEILFSIGVVTLDLHQKCAQLSRYDIVSSSKCCPHIHFLDFLCAKFLLEVNDDKSGVAPSGGSQLLGCRMHETGETAIAAKSIKKQKDRVREL